MLEKLTPEQEAKFPLYVEKFTKLGLLTHQTSLSEITPLMDAVYKAGGLAAPKQIILVDSPLACLQKYTELTGKKANSETVNFCYGSLDSAWLAYYDYFINETPNEVKNLDPIKPLIALVGKCSYYLPYEEVCIISRNPVRIFMDKARGVLHNPHGKSVEYADGFGVYTLFGVSVDGKYIDTPREDIKAAEVLQISNTEQRYAVMRHLGLDAFLKQLKPKVIDEGVKTLKGYKLMLLEVEGRQIGPYLQMACPSTGRVFIEGVGDPTKFEFIDTSIKTCAEALEWRVKQASANFLKQFDLKKQEFHA